MLVLMLVQVAGILARGRAIQ